MTRSILYSLTLALLFYLLSLALSPINQVMGVNLSWGEIGKYIKRFGFFGILQQLKIILYYFCILLCGFTFLKFTLPAAFNGLVKVIFHIRHDNHSCPNLVISNKKSIFIIIGYWLLLFWFAIGKNPQLYQDALDRIWNHLTQVLTTPFQYLPVSFFYNLLLFILVATFLLNTFYMLALVAKKIIKRLKIGTETHKYFLTISILLVITVSIITNNIIHHSPKFDKLHIWLGIDSLRYPELYDKRTMPFLYSLTQNKNTFSSSLHQVPLARTYPAFATMYSGLYANSHQIRNMFPSQKNINAFSKIENLPNLFHKKKWNTTVVADFAGDIFTRLGLKWDKVLAPTLSMREVIRFQTLKSQLLLLPFLANYFGRSIEPSLKELAEFAVADYLEMDFEKAILQKTSKKNLFLQMFYGAAHFPYSPPYPYYLQFKKKDYWGDYTFKKFINPLKPQKPNPDDQKQINNLYKASLRSIDDSLRNLFNFLKKKKLLHKTTFFIFGDHGENLYEHQNQRKMYQGHGEHLEGVNSNFSPWIIIPAKRHISRLKEMKKRLARESIKVTTSQLDMFITAVDLEFSGSFKNKIRTSGISIFNNSFNQRNLLFETGLWFSPLGDYHFQKERIVYPNLAKLASVSISGNFYIKPQFTASLEITKHRGLLNQNFSQQEILLYLPTNQKTIWRGYDLFVGKNHNIKRKLKFCGAQSRKCNYLKKTFIELMKNNHFDFLQNRFLLNSSKD